MPSNEELEKLMKERAEKQKQIARLRSLAAALLEESAVERLMFIVSTKDNGLQTAHEALSIVMRLAQQRGRKISDDEFRAILARITSRGKKEGSITIHHK